MKKQLMMLAFIAIAGTMVSCQWDSMKKETKSTDSTAVITDSVMVDSTVIATESDTTSVK